jgi:hypothetical protein
MATRTLVVVFFILVTFEICVETDRVLGGPRRRTEIEFNL